MTAELQTRTLTERLAARLRSSREKHRLSLDEVAARCDMSKTHLWQLETARSSPGIGIIYRLARLYGVSIDWLVSEDESRPS